MKTKIEWATDVWNPTWGCSKVSEGCRNCYAIRQAHVHGKGERAGLTQIVNGAPNWTGEVRLVESMLTLPLRQRKPRTYFVNSMSDLFHEALPDITILRVLTVIANSHIGTGYEETHKFIVLTKRSKRMRELCSRLRWRCGFLFVEWGGGSFILNNMPYLDTLDPWVSLGGGPKKAEELKAGWMPPQLILGVSVEDQKTKHRIDDLRETPAAIRVLSLEPLLEDLGALDLTGIGWVIVGGESGPGARSMHPDWARKIRDDCQAAKVPFFFKQWGEYVPCWGPEQWSKNAGIVYRDGRFVKGETHDHPDCWQHKIAEPVIRVGKKYAGRLLDGREWNEFPEVRP